MENKTFEYLECDYLTAPHGWLEAKLHNRFVEGFEIWRDPKNLSWRGVKVGVKSID